MIGRNTYVGDPLYSWDFHLARYFQLTEHVKLDVSVDAFNFLNRSNVDEVTSVYGSPVFCGSPAVIPHHYRDATSRAIQAGSGSTACPVGDGWEFCFHADNYVDSRRWVVLGGGDESEPAGEYIGDVPVHPCDSVSHVRPAEDDA